MAELNQSILDWPNGYDADIGQRGFLGWKAKSSHSKGYFEEHSNSNLWWGNLQSWLLDREQHHDSTGWGNKGENIHHHCPQAVHSGELWLHTGAGQGQGGGAGDTLTTVEWSVIFVLSTLVQSAWGWVRIIRPNLSSYLPTTWCIIMTTIFLNIFFILSSLFHSYHLGDKFAMLLCECLDCCWCLHNNKYHSTN